MSHHTPPPRHAVAESNPLPRGRAGLFALEGAVQLVTEIGGLAIPRGMSHLRDHLVRAADNSVLRLSEASGRTLGIRYQHLEAAYAENQEVQSDLALLQGRGVRMHPAVTSLANRVGGLIHGLLRSERAARSG